MLVGASNQLRNAGLVLVVLGGFAFFFGMRAAIARAAGESIEDDPDARAEDSFDRTRTRGERRLAPIYRFVSLGFAALAALLLAVGVVVLIVSIL
jgi:hypothetical protein